MSSKPIYSEFISKLMSCKDVRPDAAEFFTEKWFSYSTGQLSRPSKEMSILYFVENIEKIAKLYFVDGYSPNKIIRALTPDKTGVSSIQMYSKHAFRDRTSEEIEISNKINHAYKGSIRNRLDLFGAEEEFIRLYKSGVSLERMMVMFGCASSPIKKVLVDAGIFRDPYYEMIIIKRGYETVREKHNNRTEEDWISIKEKTKNTVRKKYNDDSITHPSQVKEIHEKQQKYNYYEYIMPSGKKINTQGYERWSLDDYFKEGGFEENIELRRPFKYELNGQQKRYFADMVLIDTGKVIETKSEWTLKTGIDKNIAIMTTILNQNIQFEFWVYTQTGKRTILRSVEEVSKFLNIPLHQQ